MADLEDEFLGCSDPEGVSASDSNEFDGFSDLESERDENTIVPLDPPPTDHIFDSFEDFWRFLLTWSRPRGYGIRKGRTKLNKDGTGLRRVRIQCDKAGKPRATGRTRDSGSKGVACPFAGDAVLNPDGYWQFFLTCSAHGD
jgi:hypothetical protein